MATNSTKKVTVTDINNWVKDCKKFLCAVDVAKIGYSAFEEEGPKWEEDTYGPGAFVRFSFKLKDLQKELNNGKELNDKQISDFGDKLQENIKDYFDSGWVCYDEIDTEDGHVVYTYEVYEMGLESEFFEEGVMDDV